MHPEVTATEPGTCPKCGMKLVAAAAPAYVCPMHPEVTATEPGTCPKCGMKLVAAGIAAPTAHEHAGPHDHDTADGLEWEDLMPDINAQTDASNMLWKLVDADTGAENTAIDWSFKVGDRVKIRLENTMDSDHPMHHPFHVHGAGRFLVLARTINRRRTSCGRTPFSFAPVRPSTSSSRSPSPGCGWPTATSPSTTRTG
jgi:FtsP/CotA-like multicopper oxidase with cupredoxin domain